MNLDISYTEDPVKKRSNELVERKGTGHPDSIADGIAESISRELSRQYRERTGEILHHNTDEAQLVAGSSNPEYRGGEIVDPIYILLAGRATKKFEDKDIPVERTAVETAQNYVRENFKILKPGHIEFESKIGETSTDLRNVYEKEVPLSNDTSFGVGHAPLSDTEKTVKRMESKLLEIEEVGEDIKVMGLRSDNKLQLTVAAAIIDSRVSGLADYKDSIEKIRRKARKLGEKITGLETEVNVNTADNYEEESVYLTVTGTSAEMGDDGSVGRGNRSNGLITPHRSMSMEAASGKNPVTHVGKIYNLTARKIAEEIHSKTGEFAQVKMLSEIGRKIDQPKNVEVETEAEDKKIEEIVERNLNNIQQVTEDVLRQDMSTF
ncbi:MAG: S-adenosylmethionine synthetase [Nanohaloarchaea archaeon SW_10_44_10]|nr:MAG: S-adenosylmethionine synthetase [Nanohaloarchaea archaeon SW_10_44_10]